MTAPKPATNTRQYLEFAKQGLWKSKDGRIVKIAEMNEDWITRIIDKLDVFRSKNSPSARDHLAILTIFKAEADRRGIRHPVFYPPEQRCACGKKGIYRVRNLFFCSDCRHKAVLTERVVMIRIDRSRTPWEIRHKEQDDHDLSVMSRKGIRASNPKPKK